MKHDKKTGNNATAALADIMIGSLNAAKHVHTGSWPVLAAWAVVTPALAAWRFNWD